MKTTADWLGDRVAVEGVMSQFVEEVARSKGVGVLLESSESTIHLSLLDPDISLTLTFENGEPTVELGPTSGVPTVSLEMATEVAHELFLGRTNLWAAISSREILVRGDPRPVGRIWPVIEFSCQGRYQAIARAAIQ